MTVLYSIAVIGGGAAGMMAAGYAAEISDRSYISVTLFEKNDRLGKKLSITGKGRCNVTNNCDLNTFLENVPTNPRFLYSALSSFSPRDSMEFFEGEGIPLKTERGRRVFPQSDKASDIVNALYNYCRKGSVKIVKGKVTEIKKDNDKFKVFLSGNVFYEFDRVIVATGGCSYPTTGSDGDGYKFARSFGISVTPLHPSLVPLETEEKWVSEAMGLSLKNVSVDAFDPSGKNVYSDFGEMLFTHFGLSGPMILSLSSHLPDIDKTKYTIKIDLKPALDEKTLDRRIISDFERYKNRNYENALSDLLPSKLKSVFISLSGIDKDKKVNSITKEERETIVKLLKNLTLTVKRTRPISEAIITSGGVSVFELSPKSMESKKVSGLYFAGEVVDVDAYTGGYNLQIAFALARLASRSAVDSL